MECKAGGASFWLNRSDQEKMRIERCISGQPIDSANLTDGSILCDYQVANFYLNFRRFVEFLLRYMETRIPIDLSRVVNVHSCDQIWAILAEVCPTQIPPTYTAFNVKNIPCWKDGPMREIRHTPTPSDSPATPWLPHPALFRSRPGSPCTCPTSFQKSPLPACAGW